MKKRFLASVLTLCMLIGLMPTGAWAEETAPAPEGQAAASEELTVADGTEETPSETATEEKKDEADPRNVGYDGKPLPKAPNINDDVVNVTPDNAQYTLDGAYGSIDGKTINFTAGKYDETLVLGRNTKYEGSGTLYYPSGQQGPVPFENLEINSVDTYLRTVQNVTFTSEKGAVVKGFSSSSGHAYGHDNHTEYDYVKDRISHTTNDSYYRNTILENITFDGLTVAEGINIFDYAEKSKYDGIHIRNCTFQGNAEKMEAKDTSFRGFGFNADTKYCSNVKVENCTFGPYGQGVYIQGTVLRI